MADLEDQSSAVAVEFRKQVDKAAEGEGRLQVEVGVVADDPIDPGLHMADEQAEEHRRVVEVGEDNSQGEVDTVLVVAAGPIDPDPHNAAGREEERRRAAEEEGSFQAVEHYIAPGEAGPIPLGCTDLVRTCAGL